MNSADAVENNNNNNNTNNTNNEIVILMANMINYLNVSFYESLFTYNHEQARAELNAIYESVALKPPSLDDSVTFYRNVLYLKSVTDTDDSTYHVYMRQLKSYIQKLKMKDSSPSSS
jgi:hypothetical protein